MGLNRRRPSPVAAEADGGEFQTTRTNRVYCSREGLLGAGEVPNCLTGPLSRRRSRWPPAPSPSECGAQGASLYLSGDRVVVVVRQAPDDEETLREQFKESTGLDIEWETRDGA